MTDQDYVWRGTANGFAPDTPVPRTLTPREKAAVIVRLLLAEGARLPLAQLPEHVQAALARQIGTMRLVDRVTLDAVVAEFVAEVEMVGLSFPGGVEGALSIMDGHISPAAATRLRRLAGSSTRYDPWERIAATPEDQLEPFLQSESVEVAAVLLSKLPVPKAAALLGRLPGERARRVAYAVSLTGGVDPETVRRIGLSLAEQIDSRPPRAFDADPAVRVGAILNVSTAPTRDGVLSALLDEDADFGEQVRRAIFTFAHIPDRVAPRDVPRVLRLVESSALVTAMAAARNDAALAAVAEFLLANTSQRMAQSLREEAAERGTPRPAEAEAAMSAVIAAIRTLQERGEIELVTPPEG